MRVVRAQLGNLALYEGIVANYAISGKTAETSGIFMGYYRLPPGARSVAHFHEACETATYIVKGHAQIYSGEDLSTLLTLAPGDMLYIPANEVHMMVNPAATEWLEYLSARSAPGDMLVEVSEAVKHD